MENDTIDKQYKTVKDFYDFLTGFPDFIYVRIHVVGFFKFDCDENLNKKAVELCDNADVFEMSERLCRSTISFLKETIESTVLLKKPQLLISLDNKLIKSFFGTFNDGTGTLRIFFGYSYSPSEYLISKYTKETLNNFIKNVQNYSIDRFRKAVCDKLYNPRGLKFFSVGSNDSSRYYTLESIKKEYRGLPINDNDIIEKLFKKTQIRDHFLYICNVDHEALKKSFGFSVDELVEYFKRKSIINVT